MAIALRYKLRMFGIPIDGAADVFCDNQGVVKNTSLPESVLSKKHNGTRSSCSRNYESCERRWRNKLGRSIDEESELTEAEEATQLYDLLRGE